jgi:hypothetical protein
MKMKMNMKIRVDGKEASADHLAETLTEQIQQKTRDAITARLGGIVCPRHNRGPEVKFAGDSTSATLTMCCSELETLVRAQLATESLEMSG